MFHLKYPRFRGFFTWEELGCLARALGYPVDLFKKNVTPELTVEEHGLSIKEVYKMVDHRLLERSLHRTCNLHSGDWNMNVVRKCLYLLSHQALTFEEISNIRIAYQAFEAFDMKGMLPDEQTVLRSLKMCGRSIAPMKLMHRLKHMSMDFEDKSRIQLAEYLDLTLWCGQYKEYTPEELTSDQDKERDLYKLADFEKLLSHHDDRLAKKLNKEYLEEEWDFGRENLGSKKMFKEPPIICAEERMEMEDSNFCDDFLLTQYLQAKRQKRVYRHLKREVVKSQKMVYRAKAGFVRDRPLTAPDLSMYRQQDSPDKPPVFSAQTAYEIIQKRINSAKSTTSTSSMCDTSDRPRYVKTPEVPVPRVICQADLEETKKKFEDLTFDIATLERRYELSKEQQLNYYIPGYSERDLESESEDSQIINLEDNDSNSLSLTPRPSPRRTLTEEAINNLAYPKSKNFQSHSNMCDARNKQKLQNLAGRFRGWHGVKVKKGGHYILTSPTFENSYKGRLQERLHLTSRAQVKNVRGDFVYRYTKQEDVETPKSEARSRPYTAPASMQSVNEEVLEMDTYTEHLSPTESSKTVDTGYGSSPTNSMKTVDTGYGSSPTNSTKTVDTIYGSNEDKIGEKNLSNSRGSLGLSTAWNSENDSINESANDLSLLSDRRENNQEESNDAEMRHSESSDAMSEESLGSRIVDKSQIIPHNKGKKADAAMDKKVGKSRETISVDHAPVPYMQHSKPKVVAVGGIGKISLLESISESQYWEDLGEKARSNGMDQKEDGNHDENCDTPNSLDSGLVEEDIKLNLSLLKNRLSTDRSTDTKTTEKRKSTGNAVKDQLLKEKSERLKKQKRLQGPSIDKIGILTHEPRERKLSSTSSNDSLRKSSVSSKDGNMRKWSMQSVSSTKENSQSNNNRTSNTSSVNNDPHSNSTSQNAKNIQKSHDNGNKRNSVTPDRGKTFKRGSLSQNNKINKYERLVKRAQGSISETLTTRLLSTHA